MADDAVAALETAFDQPRDRARIEAMLLREDARRERRLVVAREHRHHRLGDDRAVVELGGDEMDARPARLAARLDRTPVRLQPGERRQQRRMDVDEAAVEAAHEGGAEDAHEAGQRDDVGAVALDALGERVVEVLAVRERAVIDDLGGDAALAREREPAGVGAIADHGGDVRVPVIVGAGAHDRLHVGAAARDEDDDVLHRRAQCIGAAGADTYNGPLLPACRR